MEIKGPIAQGSTVIINRQWTREDEHRQDRGDGMSSRRSVDQQSSITPSGDQEKQNTSTESKDDSKM